MILHFSENWNVRSTNIDKQSHLLTAAELKCRGITRYDAEILVSQGITLPDPRSSARKFSLNIPTQVNGKRVSKRKQYHMERVINNNNVTSKVTDNLPVANTCRPAPQKTRMDMSNPRTRSQLRYCNVSECFIHSHNIIRFFV